MSLSPSRPKRMRIGGYSCKEELRVFLMPTLQSLIDHKPESLPFMEPVDPIELAIPHYFQIIKTPMDLSNIKKKLDEGVYEDAWEYVQDVWLMFNNAWKFNRRTSYVHKCAVKLAEKFGGEIDKVMKGLGYCCGREYSFLAQALYCFGKDNCVIPRNAKYYLHSETNRAFCEKCFNDLPDDNTAAVVFADHAYSRTDYIKRIIRKNQCVLSINDEITPESFVQCTRCKRKFHQVCVLHVDCIWPEGFTCRACLEVHNLQRPLNRYNAERLRRTRLGDHIEARLKRFLKYQNCQDVNLMVRVLSSLPKIVQVKEGVKSRFVDNGQMCGSFPYITKAIFVFEKIDNVDVCFFGMHVQEYGSEAPAPNSRRVYISYLDSVHFFEPGYLRTAVYHEILLGYLDYVKKLGYATAHIWACPPNEGDDYIFHGHPPDQKIPKAKRLLEWYKKMLDKGINERIILRYKDIFKQAVEDKLNSVTQFPYFDGDFWSDKLEELAKQIDNHENGPLTRSVVSSVAVSVPKRTPSTSNMEKKSTANNGAQKLSKKMWFGLNASDDLTAKLFSFMKDFHEDFLVVHLHPNPTALPLIRDPDPFIVCDLMDGRDAFLLMAKERHFDFSSLRRSKYGTMLMLYEIHNLAKADIEYVCNGCQAKIKTRYHCTMCEDYDLCINCNRKTLHPHRMYKLSMESGEDDAVENIPPQRSRSLTDRYVASWIHAGRCKNDTCQVTHCHSMKCLADHARMDCPKRRLAGVGGCKSCKQLMVMCYSHAKNCRIRSCCVPLCFNIKFKMWQKKCHIKIRNDATCRRLMRVHMQKLAIHQLTKEVESSANPAIVQNEIARLKRFFVSPNQDNGRILLPSSTVLQTNNFNTRSN